MKALVNCESFTSIYVCRDRCSIGASLAKELGRPVAEVT